jgi:glycerol-3-phosphate dehydrogenase
MVYDITIIGAGVIGCFLAREFSRYDLKICILEKEYDVSTKTSSANSGIIHAGYDAAPGSLKGMLNARGNIMMEQVSRELGFPFKRIGSLVLSFNEKGSLKLRKLYNQGIKNGIKNLQILSARSLKEMEPNISDKAREALYSPDAGIVCPYEMAFGAIENAVENGVSIFLDCEVKGIRKKGNVFNISSTKGDIKTRFVLNAAGVYSDKIAAMAGDKSFKIRGRKGEYLLLDKSQGSLLNTVVFQPPTKKGKGVLVTPTVDGNLLIGPTAVDTDKEDNATTYRGASEIARKALKSVPAIDLSETITTFAGIRATPYPSNDFIIRESTENSGFFNVAGIDSPGLSSAPAIAEFVVSMFAGRLNLVRKTDFNAYRNPVRRFCEMDENEAARAIEANPLYGRIVCRCETVTEAEIVESIKRPLGARTIDGVKRRTRSGMGRCQGGFCTPRITEILTRELGISPGDVKKNGGRSFLLARQTKDIDRGGAEL